jgi:uncharacterized protein (DUF488 family)
MKEKPLVIWTVGHSTRSIQEFIAVLKAHCIEMVADVRSFPRSRRHRHFDSQPLAQALHDAGIEYVWLPTLGGRRRSRPDSPNTAWRSKSFRAYADYMQTDQFREGVTQLLTLAREKRAVVMCAEAVWWRCHRSLIADFLKASGVKVVHIFDETKTEEHPYTPAAQVRDGRLSYEGPDKTDNQPTLWD